MSSAKPISDFSILKMIAAAAAVMSLSVTQLSAEVGAPKKTGQTVSYAPFDDGHYQAGVAHSYTRDAAKETVTDTVTGLMWQDDAVAASTSRVWQGAVDYCMASERGGYSDWRLPSIKELQTLVDDGDYSPTINSTFQNSTSDSYWSSTTSADGAGGAWYVNFNSGSANYDGKSNGYYVRCVRGGQ